MEIYFTIYFVIAIFFIVNLNSCNGELGKTCLESINRLPKARKINGLYGECSRYRKMSCCTNTTAYEINQEFLLKELNHSICAPISNQCLKMFARNHCSHHCSPNFGPWVQKDTRPNSLYQYKYTGIPLCLKDCKRWWRACKDHSTCVEDWGGGWDWSTVNRCPEGSTCRSFGEVYGNAKYFCNHVFSDDYAVTPDDQPCIKLTFRASDNFNEEVEKFYHEAKNTNEGD